MSEALRVTRITHSCHLIQIGQYTVLTDPWFSERPLYHPGEPVAMGVSELPRLDAIVITHAHYDHCDLAALAKYPDKSVPLFVAAPVLPKARQAGFEQVLALAPWQAERAGELTITAAPGKHGVYEVTFVIAGGGRAVYFAGDTLLIPELRALPERFPRFDVCLVPTNGLCIRPQLNRQVVMNAREAAELTALLRPRVTVPHHYAFTSGWLGDHLLTKGDRDPWHFVEAARQLAPEADARVLAPGEPLLLDVVAAAGGSPAAPVEGSMAALA